MSHPKPTHEEIATAAFQLWRAKGQPQGKDVAIWLAAEHWLIDQRFFRSLSEVEHRKR